MDETERLITQVISGLVSSKVLVKTAHHGYELAIGLGVLVGLAVEYLLKLLFTAGRRIATAIRTSPPENNVIGVIFREIISIGSDSVDEIIKHVMAIVDFLKKLLGRGANFTHNLGQRSLEFTSVSSVRRN